MKEKKFNKDGFSCHHTKKYLDLNRERGLGKGLTVKTYASMVTSPDYARYTVGRIFCDLGSHQDRVVRFFSEKGREAYYPIDMLTEEIKGKLKLFESLQKLDPTLTWMKFRKYY